MRWIRRAWYSMLPRFAFNVIASRPQVKCRDLNPMIELTVTEIV
jgi:hypothetical protein